MSAAIIYAHPDGHQVAVGAGLLTACTSDGAAVSLPIGLAGLRDVAAKLLALAGGGNDDSEQAGAGIALACLDALMAAKDSTQGQRIRAVQSAIVQLSATGDPGAAAAGFACIVENVLSRGMGGHK